MNTEYIRQAYLRTILSELQRHVLDKYVSMDGSPKETLLCEEVLFQYREITQDAFVDILDKLIELEAAAKAAMAGYEFRKQEPPIVPSAAEPTRKAISSRRKTRRR